MSTTPVQSLLGAVRRRLWQGQFIAAVRLAAWGASALLLLAGAAHLAARPVLTVALLAAIALLGVGALARAALQRPSEGACALWADRHLGGASAYSTLLETRTGAAPQTHAVRWLEQWATASVPEGRRLLAGRRDPARLVRPLFSLLVAAAIAGVVLTLPARAPSSRPALEAPTAPHARDAATSDAAPALASTGLAGELASALRSAESRDAPDRGSMGPAQVERGRGEPQVGAAMLAGEPMAAQSGPATPAASGASDNGAAAQAGTKGTGAGGREAGTGRDDPGRAGVSQALERTFPIESNAMSQRAAATARQADMDQPGLFDDAQTANATVGAGKPRAPVAATPPLAAKSVVLAPAEAAYVQAWLKAVTERR